MKRKILALVAVAVTAIGCDPSDPLTQQGVGIDFSVLRDGARPQSDMGMEADASERDNRLNSIFPNRGVLEGGTRVRIVGQEFVEGMRVSLGLRGCTDVEVSSESHLHCTVPPADQAGAVRVRVQWPEGGGSAQIADGYDYYVALTVNRLEPERGPTNGGIDLTLYGRGMDAGTTVRFAGIPADRKSIADDGESMVVVVPPGLPGSVDVEIRGLNGRVNLSNGFTYAEDLIVTAVQPRFGSVAGGEEVLFAGVGLADESIVRFGDSQADVLGSELEREALRVLTPPMMSPGPVSLGIENANGSWSEAGGFLFLAVPEAGFEVHGLAPSRVPTDGGTTIFVGGNGFDEQTVVDIDGVRVGCTLLESRVLSCQTAPHPPGRVDLRITTGEQDAHLIGALSFYERVDVFDLEPARGSVAGGTLVEVLGEGLNADVRLFFGEKELTVVEVLDETRLYALTPPNSPGCVSLRVESDSDEAILPDAYDYFEPGVPFGGIWGEEIDDAVNITTLDSATGRPVGGAQIIVIGLLGQGRWEAVTDANGQATVSDSEIELPVSVTAVAQGYTAQTFERVTAENSTLLLMPQVPPSGGGDMEPIEPVILSGVVRGLDDIEKPENEGYALMAFVEISHNSPGGRLGAPPPRPNGILMEDGPFEIQVRPGEHAVVVTAGYMALGLMRQFENGELPFWSYRDALQPVAMGLRRFVTASPGDVIEDLEVRLDIPLNQTVQVELLNPSGGVPGAPDRYVARPILDLGAEGFFDFRYESPSETHRFVMSALPDMRAFDDPEIAIYWEGEAEQSNPDLPYRTSWASTTTRDFSEGVTIGPFVGTTAIVEPSFGGQLSPFRWVEWTSHPGIEGLARPTEPADLHIVRVSDATNLVWMHVVPGAVNRFQFPQLPFPEEGEMSGDLPEGRLQISVYSVSIEGEFEFDDFTFQNLGRVNAYSWSYGIFER